jgi:Helix-turn-helix family
VDAITCTARTEATIVTVGGAFMLDPVTTELGSTLGLDFGEFYGLGRGGVLGSVDADVVASAFVFFNPAIVRAIWEAAIAKRDPADAAAVYADACQSWGRDRIGSADGLDELAPLLDRVVAGASPIGAPLFAGWRAVPLPEDAAGRVMHQLHVLRELRGGLHGCAVLAAGLSPLEALIVNSPDQAALFGWSEPLPDPEPLRGTYADARAATSRLVAVAFELLGDAERDRLCVLLDGVRAATGL